MSRLELKDRIVASLRGGPLSVQQLAVRLGASPDGVRQGLAKLRRASVIERDGQNHREFTYKLSA